MAHEIDMTTGAAAVFVTGQAAWHRLGRVVADAQTSAEAIRLAGLDWEVQQWPLLAVNPTDPTDLRPTGAKVANVRSDTHAVLGVVGDGYRPFQNKEAFDFMDAIVGERLAMFETAGALKGGRRVWMLARIPQTLRIAGADEVRPYVLLTNSHDGNGALRMIPTTVRVVCQNTLNLALGRAGSEGLAITHTESLSRRVAEARRNLGIITAKVDEYGEQAQQLARRSLTGADLRDYFTKLVEGRAEKSQGKLLDAFLDGFENERQRLPGIEGSWWAAYNAISEYADHRLTVFGKDEATRLDNRVHSMWFGTGAALKQRAWELALGMAS